MSMPTPEQMAQWPPPNYIDPDTRVTETIAVTAAGTVLMLIFVAGRIGTRFQVKAGFTTGDWIIFAGAIIATGTSILGCIGTQYGLGFHLYDLKPEWLPIYGKMSLSLTTLFNACVTFPKLSLCFTYLRLFPSQGNRIFCWCMIAFLTGWLISSCVATVLQCLPIQGAWDLTIPGRKCINISAFSIAAAASNSATDFLVFWWPARSLWKIQLPLKQRLGLVFIFAIGSTICVAGVLRAYYIHKLFQSYEVYYDGAIIMMIGSLEWNIGIVFACMHSIKPILARAFPRLFGTVSQTSRYKSMGQSKNMMPLSPYMKTAQWDTTRLVSVSNETWETGDNIELPKRAIQYTRQVSVSRSPVSEFSENGIRSPRNPSSKYSGGRPFG